MREVYYVYRCPDPDCGLVGLLHDYEYTTRSTPPIAGSWVPCPRCAEPMIEVRKAQGEDINNTVRVMRHLNGGALVTYPDWSWVNRPRNAIKPHLVENSPGCSADIKSVKPTPFGLLKVEQVARELGLSVQTVRGLWKSGELGHIQFTKKQRLCSREQIQEYLNSRTKQTQQSQPEISAPPLKRKLQPVRSATPIQEVRKQLSSWDHNSDEKE